MDGITNSNLNKTNTAEFSPKERLEKITARMAETRLPANRIYEAMRVQLDGLRREFERFGGAFFREQEQKDLTERMDSILKLSDIYEKTNRRAGYSPDAIKQEESVKQVIATIEEQKLYVKHLNAVIEGGTEEAEASSSSSEKTAALEDGTYRVAFNTDSSMFHVNETMNGKGTLTVKDGKMTLHITLASKNIVGLFPGTAADAQKDGAEVLQPTTDTVTYSDGTTEEVYGFDVPVESLDQDFDLALVGKKGKWYDHKVNVSDPIEEK